MLVRENGPTPSGGAYSTAFYTDAEGKSCSPEQAVHVCISEYAEDGRLICETWGTCGAPPTESPVKPSLLKGQPWFVVASVGVVLFALFSFAGWLYETVENVFTFGGIYLRASLMLPWCPIYGIGGLIIVAALEPVRRRLAARVPTAMQVIAIVIGIYALTTVVELAGSYACEAVMGYVPWDYSDAPLNFQGRIAPMYTMRFVVLGLVALYGLYPLVARWAQAHGRAACVVAVAILVLFAADVALEAAGVWAPVKESLVPHGINHW